MFIVNDVLLGQLVVFSFLLIASIRPILKKTQYTDSLSFFPVIALFVNILLIFSYGLSIIFIVSLCVSILSVIINASSLYRFLHSLYSDRDSAAFKLSSYLTGLVVIICMILVVIFKPIPINTDEQNNTLYTGSFSRGFTEKKNITDKTTLIITEYIPLEKSLNNEVVVVYLPQRGTTAQDSALRLSLSASLGVGVITGDFFASGDGSFTLNKNPVISPFNQHFTASLSPQQEESLLLQKEQELEHLLLLAGQKFSSVIIVAEGENKGIALSALKKYPAFVKDVFFPENEKILEDYYGKQIADLAFINPLDCYLSKFDSWEDYSAFRSYGKEELPHLRFARMLAQKVENISEEK